MILEYNYWYFISAIPPDVCDAILEYGIDKMADQEKRLGAQSTDGVTGDFRQKDPEIGDYKGAGKPLGDRSWSEAIEKGEDTSNLYVRDSKVVFLEEPWLYEIVWPYVKAANVSANWNFEWDHTEPLQFTKYNVGQFYGWHADCASSPYGKFDPATDEILKKSNGDPYYDKDGNVVPAKANLTADQNYIGKIRKLSVTISLSDPKDYDGGNLKFDFGPHAEKQRFFTCEEIRPKGSVIVFPSHIYHQVTPVTRGTRYSLVAWNLGKPFK